MLWNAIKTSGKIIFKIFWQKTTLYESCRIYLYEEIRLSQFNHLNY